MNATMEKRVMELGLEALKNERRQKRRERNCARLLNIMFDQLVIMAGEKTTRHNPDVELLVYRLKNRETGYRIISGKRGSNAFHKRWRRVYDELDELGDEAAGGSHGYSWRDDNLPFWRRGAASHSNNDFSFGVLDVSIEMGVVPKIGRLWVVSVGGSILVKKLAHTMAKKALGDRIPEDLAVCFRSGCYVGQVDVDGADWSNIRIPRWSLVKQFIG